MSVGWVIMYGLAIHQAQEWSAYYGRDLPRRPQRVSGHSQGMFPSHLILSADSP